MKERIVQLDYLKGIFVLLMVLFHIRIIAEQYPIVCKAVYTFHMSAFLIISGYLVNIDKRISSFCKSLLRLLIPYVLFEIIYIVMIYYLGNILNSQNRIEDLSLFTLLYYIVNEPKGPYWYIHTLIICSSVYYIVCNLLKFKSMSAFALMGAILYGLSLVIGRLEMSNIIYFLIGVFIIRSGNNFISFIHPSIMSVIPLFILFLEPDNMIRGSLQGVAITFLVISFLLFIFDYSPNSAVAVIKWLGQNSLSIVFFSPFFTILTKIFLPFFSFDPSYISFAFFALIFVVISCLGMAYLLDKCYISKFLFFKENLYVAYKK